MSNGLFIAGTYPAKRQIAEETLPMKAIVVTDQAAGTAGMRLVERPEPHAAINDVVVQVHASGFTSGELTWPSTWTDRLNRDRTPSIPGQELAGVVTALGYGTTGLSVGQRVFGLSDSYRGGTLAEYVAVEARNLAPLPGDVDFTVGASVAMPGLTAWQGLFDHGRLQAGQSALVHGAAGAVGSMVTQLAREFGAYVIGTGRAADRQKALDFGAQEFVDLDNDALEDVGGVDLVFDVAADDIENQIDSADVFQRVVVEVDELLRAEVERLLTVGSASGADDVSAELTCELRHHRTDCAGRAVHEGALPRLKTAMVEQSLPRSQARHRHARAHREVDVARQRREVACLDGHILRQGAAAIRVREAEHPLSHRQPRRAVAESGNHSGQLLPGNNRRPVTAEAIGPGRGPRQLIPGESRRMNLNDDVVYRCLGLGPLRQRHPRRSRGLIDHHNRLHVIF